MRRADASHTPPRVNCPVRRLSLSAPAAARGATTRPVLTTDHGFFLVPHPEMDIGANGEVGDRPRRARVRQWTTVRERPQARHNRPFVTFPSDCEISFSQLSCLPPLTFRHPRRRHHVPKALVGASRHPFHPPPPQTPPTSRPTCPPKTVTDTHHEGIPCHPYLIPTMTVCDT